MKKGSCTGRAVPFQQQESITENGLVEKEFNLYRKTLLSLPQSEATDIEIS